MFDNKVKNTGCCFTLTISCELIHSSDRRLPEMLKKSLKKLVTDFKDINLKENNLFKLVNQNAKYIALNLCYIDLEVFFLLNYQLILKDFNHFNFKILTIFDNCFNNQ
jgi:hypothetical protein